jgi:hypothetical protein
VGRGFMADMPRSVRGGLDQLRTGGPTLWAPFMAFQNIKVTSLIVQKLSSTYWSHWSPLTILKVGDHIEN